MKKLLVLVLLLCSFSAQAGSVQDWNNEFMRLNGIPHSKGMDLSAASTKEYFMAISRNGGYKLPDLSLLPPPRPSPVVAPVPAQPNPSISQNATAKQLIKTILDAAAALDKL